MEVQVTLTLDQLNQVIYCMEQMESSYFDPGDDRDAYMEAMDLLVIAHEEAMESDQCDR